MVMKINNISFHRSKDALDSPTAPLWNYRKTFSPPPNLSEWRRDSLPIGSQARVLATSEAWALDSFISISSLSFWAILLTPFSIRSSSKDKGKGFLVITIQNKETQRGWRLTESLIKVETSHYRVINHLLSTALLQDWSFSLHKATLRRFDSMV